MHGPHVDLMHGPHVRLWHASLYWCRQVDQAPYCRANQESYLPGTVQGHGQGLPRLQQGWQNCVTTVHCNQEFKHLMDKVSDDLDVEMNYTMTGEHVPEVERNNRTLKERMRAMMHRWLPFKAMPKEMLGALARTSCQQLNFFPAKTGVSSYYSPYAIMTGKNLDYNQFKIPFGQSIQASDEPKPYNTMEPRTFDCIVLGPSDNIQTGWKLLAGRIWKSYHTHPYHCGAHDRPNHCQGGVHGSQTGISLTQTGKQEL
jgi:hypothetical protein